MRKGCGKKNNRSFDRNFEIIRDKVVKINDDACISGESKITYKKVKQLDRDGELLKEGPFMFLAEEAAAEASNFQSFDLFMIAFTVLIGIGVFRLFRSPYKNKFSLGLSTIFFLLFVMVDALMIMNWMGVLQDFQNRLFS